jgi:predicted membrane protein
MSSPPPAPSAPTKLPVMSGGARAHVFDLIQKYAQPLSLYIGVLLVLGIVYIGQIPDWVSYQANTLFGRLFLFGATIFVADTYSWIYALLMALFTVLVIAIAPRTKPKEAFQNQKTDTEMGDTDVKLVTQKKKWYVEEVLRENPLGIEEEKVRTSAIQDNSNSRDSNSSSAT